MKPAARTDLALRDVDDEAVVYDFRRHKAHCLNATALAVFRLCDGTRTPAQMAKELSKQLGAGVDEEMVWMGLHKLAGEELLAAPLEGAPDFDRRRLLRKMALTAGLSIALPAVWSILAPTPAYAASGIACNPAGICMGVNNPPGCCTNSSGKAGTCTATGCNGTSSTCAGQTCL
ncbi:MAG: hypothetical protein JWN44_6856 [Myxococcales bacterium]|nr:hypothetical protein [Myxococcales bacterium]